MHQRIDRFETASLLLFTQFGPRVKQANHALLLACLPVGPGNVEMNAII